jgi:hypothetical protein
MSTLDGATVIMLRSIEVPVTLTVGFVGGEIGTISDKPEWGDADRAEALAGLLEATAAEIRRDARSTA